MAASQVESPVICQSHRAKSPLPTIYSFQNPRVKQTLRLRDSSVRRKTARFLIDGLKEISLAIANQVEIEAIFFALGSELELAQQLPARARQQSLQCVSPEILARLSYGQLGQSPVAVAKTPSLALSHVVLRDESLLLVLDRTEKPGNLGACLRTASACGVDAVVLTDPVCELFNPNTIRASRGTVFTLPVAIASSQELMALCNTRQLPIFTARVDGQSSLWQCDFRGGGALVFGNEAHGLGPDWESKNVRSFQIPLSGAADSLNLSISTAVTLYEAVRQGGTFI